MILPTTLLHSHLLGFCDCNGNWTALQALHQFETLWDPLLKWEILTSRNIPRQLYVVSTHSKWIVFIHFHSISVDNSPRSQIIQYKRNVASVNFFNKFFSFFPNIYILHLRRTNVTLYGFLYMNKNRLITIGIQL